MHFNATNENTTYIRIIFFLFSINVLQKITCNIKMGQFPGALWLE